MGIGYTKECSSPQGDPWSMFALALTYKPWLEVVRQIPAQPHILADDAGVTAEGEDHEHKMTQAMEATFSFVNTVGGKVSYKKSWYASTASLARKKLRNIKTDANAKIPTQHHGRELGAHLVWTRQRRTDTIAKRFNQVVNELGRLLRLAGPVHTKVNVAKGKYLNMALYGCEVAQPPAALLKKLTSKLAKVFSGKHLMAAPEVTLISEDPFLHPWWPWHCGAAHCCGGNGMLDLICASS